jgi:hypothetical protein
MKVLRPLDDLSGASIATNCTRSTTVRATTQTGDTTMFTKTVFALFTALVLTTSFVSAQAQTNGRCVSDTMEESALSAYPSWQVCHR